MDLKRLDAVEMLHRGPGADEGPSVVRRPVSDVPIEGEFDVIVAGGGTGGPFAAIAAARQGAKTLLIEPTNFLGGIGTGGEIHSYYYGLSGQLQDEVDRLVEATQRRVCEKVAGFSPEAKKHVLQKLCMDAGVEIRYDTAVAGAIVEGNRIRGVIAADAAGRRAVLCKAAIDATGDGDLAALCGAEFRFGRDGDKYPQPYSLTPGVFRDKDTITHANFDAGWVDPTDADELTRALFEGRSRLYSAEGYLPENRNNCIAAILGVRESRFIVGDATVTLEDLYQGRRRRDVVMRTWAHYDNHSQDYENESLEARVYAIGLEAWPVKIQCDVPYGALLPNGVEGLLMACRAVSVTHDSHQCFRMQRDMQQLGEVAGRAAAIAAARGVAPRQVPIECLQEILVASGGLKASVRAEGCEPGDRPLAKQPQDLVADLATEARRETLVELYRAGKGAHEALRRALRHENAATRRDAAILLGLQGDASGFDELLEVFRDRVEDMPKGHRPFPRWHAAIVCFEVLKDRRAAPALVEALDRKGVHVRVAGLILRALSAIGDASALPAVLRAFDRTDYEALQGIIGWRYKGYPSPADWAITLRIGTASVAADLGDFSLIEKIRNYGESEHALVRRFARRQLARLAPVAAR